MWRCCPGKVPGQPASPQSGKMPAEEGTSPREVFIKPIVAPGSTRSLLVFMSVAVWPFCSSSGHGPMATCHFGPEVTGESHHFRNVYVYVCVCVWPILLFQVLSCCSMYLRPVPGSLVQVHVLAASSRFSRAVPGTLVQPRHSCSSRQARAVLGALVQAAPGPSCIFHVFLRRSRCTHEVLSCRSMYLRPVPGTVVQFQAFSCSSM